MGVDASAFALATMAKPHEMLWLTETEAERLGFSNNGTLPTTAEIKIYGGRPYLKLEQIRREATSRILISYFEDRFIISAGIVTNPELSAMKAESTVRSYLEIDYKEAAPITGPNGVSANGSVLWIQRDLTPEMTCQILSASNLDTWIENGGPFRWGAQMETSKVQPQIETFIRNSAS
jgi:hypothetical protein